MIGAQFDDDNGTDSGSAYIYELNGADWVETAKITASDGAGGDRFGESVALDGDRVLVGAVNNDSNASNSGSAYIYELNGADWVETAKITASDGAANDNFGESVALDGDRVLVGAVNNDSNASNSGSAYIYSTAISDQSGGGSDEKWKNKPTFGISHKTNQQIVQDGFTVNNISYDITDNWHTDFQKQTITIGEESEFSAKAYVPYELHSLEFMFGIPEVGQAHKAEAAIEVWLNKDLRVEEIKIIQKDNLINKQSVAAFAQRAPCTDSDFNNSCYFVKVYASFNEAPIHEVFALKAIDFTKRVHTTYLNDGFAVAGESLNPPKTALVVSEQKGIGLIQLTQIDKKNELWKDENGYQWTQNKLGAWIQITKPEFKDIRIA